MPIFSRQQSAAALKHIYDNVFCVTPESSLVNALTREGISNIADLLSMDPKDVEALQYESNDDRREMFVMASPVADIA